mgnify:CR=1 FL=1
MKLANCLASIMRACIKRDKIYNISNMISLFKNVVKWVRIVLAIKGSEIFKLYNTLLNKDTRNCSNLENNKY